MGCAGFVQPLDLQCLLVNNLSGGFDVFIILMFIVIGGLSAYFRMSNLITLSMFVLFTTILAPFVGLNIYLLVVLLTGILTYYSIKHLVMP